MQTPDLEHRIEALRSALRLGADLGELAIPRREPGPLSRSALPLSGVLKDFYRDADPVNVVVPWVVEGLELYSSASLLHAQEGYRFTRGDRGTLLAGWRAEWVVVGDVASDPIIVDAEEDAGPTFMAVHGTGAWTPLRVAPCFSDFIWFLAKWIPFERDHRAALRTGDGIVPQALVRPLRDTVMGHLPETDRSNLLSFMGQE